MGASGWARRRYLDRYLWTLAGTIDLTAAQGGGRFKSPLCRGCVPHGKMSPQNNKGPNLRQRQRGREGATLGGGAGNDGQKPVTDGIRRGGGTRGGRRAGWRSWTMGCASEPTSPARACRARDRKNKGAGENARRWGEPSCQADMLLVRRLVDGVNRVWGSSCRGTQRVQDSRLGCFIR